MRHTFVFEWFETELYNYKILNNNEFKHKTFIFFLIFRGIPGCYSFRDIFKFGVKIA